MAYRKQYYVRSTYYSCFSRHGEEHTTECFDTISEAWEYYKKESAHDFDYGDASHRTEPVQFRWVNDVEDNGNEGHPHCRTWYKERKGKTPIHVCDEPKTWLIFDDDSWKDEEVLP